jgi:lipopolysaccharide export LptBFGC system permease protein LptF
MRLLMYFLFIVMATNHSCRLHPINENFVKLYNTENFEKFRLTTFFIRGHNSQGQSIVFAYDEKVPPVKNNGAYVIEYDIERKIISSTNCRLMKDSSIVDVNKLERLVDEFVKYQVNYLQVDSNNNVFVSVYSNEEPDLVRFSDLKYKSVKYDKWRQLNFNWFEK